MLFRSERFVCQEKYLPRNTGMSVSGLGISGLYSIALNPLDYENIHVVDLSAELLIEFGGLTDSRNKWKYLNDDDFTSAGPNDVTIQCLLNGKIYL